MNYQEQQQHQQLYITDNTPQWTRYTGTAKNKNGHNNTPAETPKYVQSQPCDVQSNDHDCLSVLLAITIRCCHNERWQRLPLSVDNQERHQLGGKMNQHAWTRRWNIKVKLKMYTCNTEDWWTKINRRYCALQQNPILHINTLCMFTLLQTRSTALYYMLDLMSMWYHT